METEPGGDRQTAGAPGLPPLPPVQREALHDRFRGNGRQSLRARYLCLAFGVILPIPMSTQALVSSLALAVSLLTLVLGLRIAAGWRDWKMIPMLIGLFAVCTGPILEACSTLGLVGETFHHRLIVYRSLAVALIALAAVLALRKLLEQESGLRRAVARAGSLARSKAALERELENRRRAETTVLEAQTRLRAILDNTPASIFIKDLEGRYLYTNRPRAFSETEPFSESLVGKTDADVFPADVAAELRESDERAVASAKPVESEHVIDGPRGSRTYLTVTFPLRDPKGDVYAIAGVATDISKRVEATEAVRRIFRLSPALMCTLDAQGRFLMVNPAFRRTLGYPESDFVGRSYEEFIHPDDLAATREQGLRLLRGEKDTASQENRYRASDGSYRAFFWNATFAAGEKVFYGAAADITEREQQREAIRRIYQLAPVVMCTLDWSGIILAVNPVFPRILGFTENELIGSYYLDFVHPDDRVAVLIQDGALHDKEMTLSAFEARIRCKDGSYRVLSWDVSSTPGDQVMYAVARDVTDIRRNELELVRRREEIAHLLRLQTIGEMASEMSHELNQPLSAIVNFARGLKMRLREGTIATEGVAEIVEKIAEQGLRGGDLIRKILAFARRADLDAQETSLNELVHDTIILLAAGGPPTAEIELTLEASLPVVHLDRSQMQQVVFNLARNALDAVAGRADARLTISTESRGTKEIQLSVSDNGPGIPQSESERIFDAFYTTRPGGVGLGLSITRSIVQAHDGRLWVQSTPGAGTTFYVVLPIAANDVQREVAALRA